MRTIYSLLLVFISYTGFSQLTVSYDEGLQLYGYTDSEGEIKIDYQFKDAYDFRGNEALVKSDYYQIIDKTGNVIYKFSEVYDNMAPVRGKDYYSFHTSRSVGLVKADGAVIEELKTDTMLQWYEDAQGYVVYQGQKLGIFTMKRGLVLPIEFETDQLMTSFNWDGYLYFQDSASFVLKRGDKWGVISMYGDIRIPFEYDYMTQSYDNHIGAKKKGKWALLHKNTGNPLTAFIYDGFMGRYSSPMNTPRDADPYVFLKNDKVVFYDVASGKEITRVPPSEYDWQFPPYLVLTLENKMGVVDSAGTILVEFVYDNIIEEGSYITSGIPAFSVLQNGKWGIVAGKKFVFPLMECDKVQPKKIVWNIYYIVTKGHKQALYDADQKPVTGFEYDHIGVYNHRILVTSGDRNGILSTTGVVTWE